MTNSYKKHIYTVLLTGLDPWGVVCVCQSWRRWGLGGYVPRYCLHHCCTVCAPAEILDMKFRILRKKGNDKGINKCFLLYLLFKH